MRSRRGLSYAVYRLSLSSVVSSSEGERAKGPRQGLNLSEPARNRVNRCPLSLLFSPIVHSSTLIFDLSRGRWPYRRLIPELNTLKLHFLFRKPLTCHFSWTFHSRLYYSALRSGRFWHRIVAFVVTLSRLQHQVHDAWSAVLIETDEMQFLAEQWGWSSCLS